MAKNSFTVKGIIKSVLPQGIVNSLKKTSAKKQYDRWIQSGKPVPPPHMVKQLAIKDAQQKYNCKVLVETGTYLGDMVEAQKNNFSRIITIELSIPLYEKAKRRFRRDQNVTLIQGDSGKVLNEVVKDLNERAVFWLDGHYSSGITAKGDKVSPVYEELEILLNSQIKNHIILIDDARLFKGMGDYPAIEEVTGFVQSKNSSYRFEIKDDIIRFTAD